MAVNSALRKRSRLLLALYGALIGIVLIAYWFFGLRKDSMPGPYSALPNSDATLGLSVSSQRKDSPSEPVREKPPDNSKPLRQTAEESAASAEILSLFQKALNAMELSNAVVVHQTDSEFVHETFVQVSPPEPEQLSTAWDSFTQNLAAAKLRDPVAERVFSNAQSLQKKYSGREDFPYRVVHGFRAKAVAGAQPQLDVRAYGERPDIRFDEHGSAFLSAERGGGALESWSLLKKETWDRYDHLFQMMPELSGIEDPRVTRAKQ